MLSRLLLVVLTSLLLTSGVWAVTFRVALVSQSASTDWRTLDEASGRPLFLAVADGLVGIDATTGLVVPGIAESWSTTDGGQTWTFTLKSAKWADNSPLTAQDFVEAWKESRVDATTLEALDSRHLRVVFSQPLADVSVLMANRFLLFPDPANPKKGCGPFLLAAQAPNGPLILVRNPQFRDAKQIKIDRLEVRVAASFTEAGAWYRDGLVDWLPRGGGPGTLAPTDLRHAVVGAGWGAVYLRLNLAAPRLGDAAYRQSLSDALDRKALAQGLRGPRLLPMTTFVPSSDPVPDWKASATKRMGPLPEPALTILYPQGETYRAIAVEIADQWRRRLGIVVETKSATYAQVLADRASGAYEAVLTGWMGDYPDPTTFLTLFRAGETGNDMAYADPDLDALLDQLVGQAPGKARSAAVVQAQALVTAAWPALPLLSYASVNQIDLRKWSGWVANPTDIHPWQGIGPKVTPKK